MLTSDDFLIISLKIKNSEEKTVPFLYHPAFTPQSLISMEELFISFRERAYSFPKFVPSLPHGSKRSHTLLRLNMA